jgi:hypothetical protein
MTRGFPGTEQNGEEVRRFKAKRTEKRRRTGSHRGCRICPTMLTVAADSGEESRWPGGAIRRGSRGKIEGEAGPFYSRGEAMNWAGINRN